MKPEITILVMDVDGVLTDGKVYISGKGEMFKGFNVKDGYGIKNMLPSMNITPVVITARKNEALEYRCKELGIEHLYQGVTDKKVKLDMVLKEISSQKNMTVSLSSVAYIGDDFPDMLCLQWIGQSGGVTGCPADAIGELKKSVQFISTETAGNGAVRDFIVYLSKYNARVSLEKKVASAVKIIKSVAGETIAPGRYVVDDSFYYNVDSYMTQNKEGQHFESHDKYVDIQYIVYGKENIDVANKDFLTRECGYDESRDISFWKSPDTCMPCVLTKGAYIVLYPQHAHRSGVQVDDPEFVTKIVGKVLIPEVLFNGGSSKCQ